MALEGSFNKSQYCLGYDCSIILSNKSHDCLGDDCSIILSGHDLQAWGAGGSAA